MLKLVDKFLDKITMYRLALYYLIFLLLAALVLSFFGILPYNPSGILFSTSALLAISLFANKIFTKFLNLPANVESAYITALILALIITPPKVSAFASALPFLYWAAVWAMASKFIVNFKNKHIFNPAAFAVALTALTISHAASWWVGTSSMLVFVLLGGLLVVRKVRRFDIVISFIFASLLATFALTVGKSSLLVNMQRAITTSALVFFAAIMLTEPLTMPPGKDGRIAYGILVGWLFAPQVHFGSFYFTPELALLAGNVFSYIISPKTRLILKLKEKMLAGAGVWDFIFENIQPFNFRAGQYMEWTLEHSHADSRGSRRYFTLASSPTETDTLLGVKFYENSSTYKQKMLALKPGDRIVAAQLAGEFILPDDKNKKLVFIAGGIGITPFRSMIKYLLDKNEKRLITIFYSNRYAEEIAYLDVLKDAQNQLGIRTIFTLTGAKSIPKDWAGYTGYLSPEIIEKEVPDFRERTFYISGSYNMVKGFEKVLRNMGVKSKQVITDFFPGLV